MPENERLGSSQNNKHGRRWVIGSATLGVLGLITGACAPRPTPTPERQPTEIPNPLETRIQQAVEALPQSPLKDLARQALPYFSYPKPATVSYK